MIEALASFFETLFERPDGSVRTYGAWLIVLIVSVLGYFARRDRAARWRRLTDRHRRELQSRSISASAITSEAGGDIPYEATIAPCGDGYRLLVVRESGADAAVVCDRIAQSLDEMERVLRKHTQFVLSDFQ